LHKPTAISAFFSSKAALWGGMALGAHAAWGLYPVLARYLQTVSHLPTFALAAVGNAVVLLLLVVLVFPRLELAAFKKPVLWGFGLIVVVRSVTNLLSAKYTLAIYVQVVNLMVPFLVALLSATFFRERLPRFTLPALVFSLAGAGLMMTAQSRANDVKLALTASDWLGIGLAAVSGFFLALYMIFIRRSFRYQITGDTIFAVQIIALTVVMSISSLVFGESWAPWRKLRTADWLVFAAFVGIALVFANTAQITALKHLPAPLVSSLMPLRLVSTLAGGAFLLGERLTSFWQVLGAIIILVTLSLYLTQQNQ
jgi:drug/metabolite transporter (DMT)-like permease